jgi:undecaprenyl-diphosphatase
MHHFETPLLTDLALVFNWVGRVVGRAIALTLVGLLLLRQRRWLALGAFAVAESLAPLLSALLKVLVDRARPPDGLVHPVGVSFPSGHATYAGATCVALVLLFTTPGTRRRWWWALVGLGVVGMAWSRTYLQVHWLTDVIAGALLGSGVSFLVFAIAQRHVRAARGSNLHDTSCAAPQGDTVSARTDQQAVVVEPRGFDAPRSYLFVSAHEPLAAAVALRSWAEGTPDLCLTSPSPEAQDTGAFAAGRFVTLFDEPLLARRRPGESWDNFRDRFAEALRIVATYDTRAALVVCDELPDGWATPFVLDDDGIIARAAVLEKELPLP